MADFLETYHVANWRAFPVKQSAALAFHLPPGSRIKQAMTDGHSWSMDTLLMAALIDRVTQLAWMLSEDGAKGRNKPKSVYEMLCGEQKKQGKSNLQQFASGEDFLARWAELTN